MKVLHVITGLGDGGAEAVLYRLCLFDKDNHHIVISLMDEGKYGPLLEQAGINVECLGLSSFKTILKTLINLRSRIKSHRPDVVQTWMFHGDLVGGISARLAGVRNVVWGVHHTTLVKGESKRSTILIAKMNAFLSHFIPKKIIYCAEKSREVQESIGFDKSKGTVTHNGYDICNFKPDFAARLAFRKELGVSEDVFLIGHVGRFSPYKDYPTLFKAFNQVAQKRVSAKFVLVGSGLDEKNTELLDLIPSWLNKDNLYLLDRRADIPYVMNGIDLFVLSSTTEAFPNVLNEAMACSTPCVTTDVGDASVIVDATGWIADSGKPEQLADAIELAVEESEKNSCAWAKRKDETRNRIVENFSIEKMMISYQKVWSS